MGTRCGSLDPGVLLYLLEVDGLSPKALGQMLYHEAGLLGVSGRSADPRDLLAHEAQDAQVRDALALYVRRIVREIGALTAVLGGLDLLVFTAGIGEHNAQMRARICAELGFLDVRLDAAANAAHASTISRAGDRVTVAVEPTNEEWIAARHALALVAAADAPS
jgi:acetate kinase